MNVGSTKAACGRLGVLRIWTKHLVQIGDGFAGTALDALR